VSLGERFGIERFSDEFGRLCDLAKLPKRRLRDTWHRVNSLLEKLESHRFSGQLLTSKTR
jgi:hypothetical protein